MGHTVQLYGYQTDDLRFSAGSTAGVGEVGVIEPVGECTCIDNQLYRYVYN